MQLRSTESTGRFRRPTTLEPITVRPKSAEDIVKVISNPQRFPSPVRPVGAKSGITRCASAPGGTLLDMRSMDRVVQIKGQTVTVQAGVRLRDLARRLADHGLELVGSYEYPDRTVGGAISSGSLSAHMPEDGGHIAASVCSIKVVTPQGKIVTIDESQQDALRWMRQSYGLLGVIYMVTLRIRKIRSYSVRHTKMGFAELTTMVPNLARIGAGVKMYLLPFRDRAFIELREADTGGRPRSWAWKCTDWLMNRILPSLVHTVGRAFSVGRIRDPLIDGFSEATQMLVNTRLMDAGSNAMEQTGQFRKIGASSRIKHCTWIFPANSFCGALYSYREFCRRYYKTTGFRCDLPAVCYRMGRDQASFLSPSFNGPVFAVNLRSTNAAGWNEFLIDFASIASNFGGIPLFNQTLGAKPEHVAKAYGKRLEHFRAVRRQSDPDDRMLNQFFAEYIG